MKTWPLKNVFFLMTVLFSILYLRGDKVNASFRPPAIIMTSMRTSQAMAVNSQPDLYCGRTNGQLVGCWTKDKYDQWARSQGEVRSSQSFRSSPDYKTISIDQSQIDYVPTIELKAGGSQQKNKIVNLRYDIKLQDPQTQQPLLVSSTMRYGNTFSQSIAKDILSAAPAVMDFFDRQSQMQQAQKKFQQQLEYAQQKSQELVNNLRQESQNLNSQTTNSVGSGFTDVALGLLNSNSLLSQEQIHALAETKKIQSSDLRYSNYQMNAEAFELLSQQLASKVKEKEWQDIPALVEALTYADTQNSKVTSSSLEKLINSQGLIQAQSYLDNKIFNTPLKSENGQIVRRIANRYQALWAQSESMKYLNSQERAQFFLGSAFMALGDQYLASSDIVRGSGFLSAAQSIIDGLTGYGSGLSESIQELVKSVPELAYLTGEGLISLLTDPKGSWLATANFITRLPEFGSILLNSLSHDYEKLAVGNAHDKGYILGKYTLDIIGLVASAGSLSGVKNISKITGIKEALNASKDFKIIRTILNQNLEKSLTSLGTQSLDVFEKIPLAVRNGLKFSSTKQPIIADAITKNYFQALERQNFSTSKYLERLAASEQLIKSPARIEDAINFHEKFSSEISKLPKTNIEGTFSRAIPKEVIVNEVKIKLSPEDVFKSHSGQITAEHRFTIGGELGHSGLYMSEGTIEQTKAVLAAETKRSMNELIFAEKNFKLDSMLDLTNPMNIKALGVDLQALTSEDYIVTQALGDVAKTHGFKGIIFNSSKNNKALNIVIFN